MLASFNMKYVCYLLAYYLDNVSALGFGVGGIICDLLPGFSRTVYTLYSHPKSAPY